jgi:mRNA interferase MazF
MWFKLYFNFSQTYPVSVYKADLNPVIGSEQGKSRPVLVISEDEINNLLNVVNVPPITSRKPGRRIYPNETLLKRGNFGLPNESIVLCHQIRTLDKQRLSILYGSIDDDSIKEEIIEALCFQLGIDRT